MTRQQVIDRVRKMQALGRGNTPEADTAKTMARELIEKHKITEDELKVEEKRERAFQGKSWKLWLAKGIAYLRSVGEFECKISRWDVAASDSEIKFSGGEWEKAGEDYKWYSPRIAMSIEKADKTYGNTSTWMEEFTKGVIAGVLRNLKTRLGVRVKSTPDTTAKQMSTEEIKVSAKIARLSLGLSDDFTQLGNRLTKVSGFETGLKIGRLIPIPPWVNPDPIDDILLDLFDWEEEDA